MQEAVKKLFDAPWVIEEEAPLAWYCVIDSKDSVVANDVRDQKTVNRLARLPELYDALVDSTWEHCYECIRKHFNGNLMLMPWEMIEMGCCKGKETECRHKRRWELLKRVRDGK